MNVRCALVAGLIGGLLPIVVWAQRREPLSPSDSLQQLQLEPGWVPKLLAHEPQAVDPVEVAFDDAGRMWVVEMRDYPFRIAQAPQGRIVVLSDNDADGHYETAQTFADGLEMPTGLALWQQGAVVTLAGRLVYLPDADGDLRADAMHTWLVGFKEDNEQLRANHPRLGPDGWWYIACGLRGGEVQAGPDLPHAAAPARPLEIGSRDVRYDPRSGKIELITGPAQFGLAFDALGRRLFCSNRNPATQVVLEQPDLEGNPLAGLAPSVVDVIAAGEASRVYPLVDAWTTSHLHSGQFTAACGVFVRDLPNLQAEVFACEPTGSLVRRQLSQSQGPRLVQAAEDQPPGTSPREWLASRDAWFRPVNVTLAPDGQIVVVDMHRAVIEHPRWVPEELKDRPDQRWGDQAGRILWIGSDPDGLRQVLSDLRQRPLGTRADAELVQLLIQPNAWLRQTASRLLLERQATAAIAPLQQIAEDVAVPLLARIDALRCASNLASLPGGDATKPELTGMLQVDLSDPAQRSLAQVALRIGRGRPDLLADAVPQVAALGGQDTDEGLRFEAWLTLGSLSAAGQSAVPAEVVTQAPADWVASADAYQLIAAAAALRDQPAVLLGSWLQRLQAADHLPEAAWDQIPSIAQGLTQAAVRLGPAGEVDTQQILQCLAPAAQAAASRGAQAAQLAALVCLQSLVKQADYRPLLDEQHWQQVADVASSRELPIGVKRAAVGLLAHSPRPDDHQRLGALLRGQPPAELLGPLLSAWSARGGAEVDQYLIDSLAGASPQLQRLLLPLLAAKPERLELLAEQLESGRIKLRQLGSAELAKLVGRSSGPLKQRLQTQLDLISNTNRAAVITDYKACLQLAADAQRGAEVFRKHCASCHRIGQIGVDVGPNISDSRTKQPLELLTAILDPNLAIDNNYFRFVVMTDEGRVVEGFIAEETADALVLRGQDDRRERIRRDEIAEIQATGVSLMPEGLEAQIDPQAMADLIAFVKGWRYLDGSIPTR